MNGAECKLIDGKCKEVIIHKSCKIEDNDCVIKTKSSNRICKFKNLNGILKCQLFEKDENCVVDEDFSTCQDGQNLPSGQICVSIDDKTKCKSRARECSDYKDQNTCEEDTIIKSQTKKYSWINYRCEEYEVDSICTVINGQCILPTGKENTENKECIFDSITGQSMQRKR